MLNAYVELMGLLPKSPLLVGVVVAAGTGVVTVQYPGGGTQVARGNGFTPGASVFVRDGLVEGVAPALSVEVIEI